MTADALRAEYIETMDRLRKINDEMGELAQKLAELKKQHHQLSDWAHAVETKFDDEFGCNSGSGVRYRLHVLIQTEEAETSE